MRPRPVKFTYSEWLKANPEGISSHRKRVERSGEGILIAWGMESTDAASDTVGIIELRDGRVMTAYPASIQFLDGHLQYQEGVDGYISQFWQRSQGQSETEVEE
jgi:hypothetical protein